MHDEISTLIKWHEAGHKIILALVLDTWGSAPRQPGSMMVIKNDQAFEGSVSGGCVEGDVIAEATALYHFGGTKRLEYGVSNEDAWAVGLSCGGQIDVLLLTVTDNDVETLQKALKKAQAGERCILEVNTKTGDIVIPDMLSDQMAASKVASLMGNLFFIPIAPEDRMIIVGAVHIAQSLAPMAHKVGFRVTVVDPRNAFAQQERFPNTELVEEWPDKYLMYNFPTETTAVILLTHSPKLDDAGLKVALKSKAFFIGALGSKKSHAERLDRLRDDQVSEDSLNRIRGPIGLDINAQTPDEIAVSIMADVIAVKRMRNEV